MRIFDHSDNTVILIGTWRNVTRMQVRYLAERGYPPKCPSSETFSRIDVYWFRFDRDIGLIDDRFIDHLSNYDTVIISGGSTAEFVLERSGFKYIENEEDIMPLVSVGRIRGGKLDGKRIILKGGLVGTDSSYIDILMYIGVLDD